MASEFDYARLTTEEQNAIHCLHYMARRKRKRSSSLGANEFDYTRLTTEEKDAIEDLKMDNFMKVAIPESCEDASLFSVYQINTMKELGNI